MTALQLEMYSTPIDDANPCGNALDYDLSFIELEIAAKGKSGHQLGDSVVAPQPPDWVAVDRLVQEVCCQSKDLRVAVVAVRAALALHGVEGLRNSLEGLAIYIEEFWNGLHPRPDSDNPDDEIIRTNALANLCDAEGLLNDLRLMPISRSRSYGNFSLVDWSAAHAEAAGSSEIGEPSLTTIEQAFRDTSTDFLFSMDSEIAGAVAAVSRIQASVGERVNATLVPSLQPLIDVLDQIRKLVGGYLPVQEVSEGIPDPIPAVPPPGDICDRSDIIHSLDRICRWYRVNEPSSPVPALLERVKRLVAKDFMALLLEVAPNGAAEFRALAGLSPQDEA